jgi:hypothetical protein
MQIIFTLYHIYHFLLSPKLTTRPLSCYLHSTLPNKALVEASFGNYLPLLFSFIKKKMNFFSRLLANNFFHFSFTKI